MRARLALAITMLSAHLLVAQVAEPRRADATAANAIAAADIARHLGVIADDSMDGRDTPSRGLELTAQYVAEQFKALGLQPVGDSGRWIQRYPLPGHATVEAGQSGLWFISKVTKGNEPVVNELGAPVGNFCILDMRTAAVVATDTVLDSRAPGARGGGQGSVVAWDLFGPAAVVVAGPHTLASVRDARLHDKVVVYIPAAGTDTARQRQLRQLLTASNHVIVVADEDSSAFAQRREAARRHPPVVLDWYLPEAAHPRRWAVYVWAPALRSSLATAGLDLAEARAAPRPIVRQLSAVALLRVTAGQTAGRTAEYMVPNTLGLLVGREPRQVIVLTAHMDGAGRRPTPADSSADRLANRGANRLAHAADDNASGVAGLLALAKAFTALKQSGVQPRRSLLFAAISGGAKDKEFWGSTALLDAWPTLSHGAKIVADVNLDRIGHAPGDSLRIAGLQELELAVRPEWLAAQYPELRLTVVDDGSITAPASDHFAFVRNVVPSLYLHAGEHEADTAGNSPAAVDAEQEARIVRFAFYLTQALADAPRAPQWTPQGRRARYRVFGR